jgi:RNA polymerase sigma-70 factor (ECF subfamily)
MEHEDEILIKQYIDGDQTALKALIDRYTPLIYNFAVRLSGPRDANDTVQEVFIKVWKNLRKFDISKSHFKTWIFTIARNTVTDHLRKKKQLLFSDMDADEGDAFSDSIADDAILPDEALAKLEDMQALEGLLSGLPLHYQAVLVLYYQEEMTFAEIGKALGKPLNTVKSHHRRALEQLKKKVL